MYFSEIELNDFRNYEHQKIDFHRKVNIIIGENAQGKTNILEGLYMMSLGRSFRTSKDAEMIRFGSELARVKTISVKDDRELSVEIALVKNKKSIKVDGVKIKKTSELLENVYLVIFSPDDLRIVKDEPEKRRKFIDRELCQLKPVYYENLSRYKKALNQRNFLLKEERPDPALLEIWDMELASYGAKLIIERDRFCRKLNEISRSIHNDLTYGKETLKVSYESDIELRQDDVASQKQIFLDTLKGSREKDIYRRTTTKGPHRDDLKIEIDDIDVRSFGSQGQQRSAALSLKLAEIKLIKEETGEDPILLLDDVLSELDRVRQRQLLTSFGDIQIFITATELTDELREQLPDHQVFVVEKGSVKKIEDITT